LSDNISHCSGGSRIRGGELGVYISC
jgi:hypothetical protein